VRLRNLTPHPLHLARADGTFLDLPVEGETPRLDPHRQALGSIDGLSLVRTTLGAVQGLPPKVPGTIVIVSALVAEACPERNDLASPGEALRDESGRIVGAKGLAAGPGLTRDLRSQEYCSECLSGRYQPHAYGNDYWHCEQCNNGPLYPPDSVTFP
jgi:hypothetical protein